MGIKVDRLEKFHLYPKKSRKNYLLEFLYLYSESYPMVQSPKCLTICPDVVLELLPVKNMPLAAI